MDDKGKEQRFVALCMLGLVLFSSNIAPRRVEIQMPAARAEAAGVRVS